MFSELSLPVPSQQMTRYLGSGFGACSKGYDLRVMLPQRL